MGKQSRRERRGRRGREGGKTKKGVRRLADARPGRRVTSALEEPLLSLRRRAAGRLQGTGVPLAPPPPTIRSLQATGEDPGPP